MKRKLPATSIEPGDATIRCRLVIAAGLLLCVFSLISWRIFYLQVERHGHYAALVELKHRRTDLLEAHRGRIFDARGQMLAGDEPVQKIILDLGFLREREALSEAIAASEGVTAGEIRRAMNLEEMQGRYLHHIVPVLARHTGRPGEEIHGLIASRMAQKVAGEVVISREIAVESGVALRDELEQRHLGEYQTLRARIGGVVFKDSFVRRYPSEVPLFHLAGKTKETGKEEGAGQGIAGLEKFYDQRLSGKPGNRVVVVDGKGNELAAYRGEVTLPVHGENLRTTIDAGLQELVLREFDAPAQDPDGISVAQMKPNRVIVVLFEPKTMALRAVATRDFTRKPEAGPLLVNDLVEYVYEPGSTIKIATIAAALSHGRVGPESTVSIDPDGDGVYDDGDIEPIRDDHPYESLTVGGIMVKSSNIGAYKLARGIGIQRFREYLSDLGFISPTGIGLPLEQRGWFPRQWNMQSLSRTAYGYAFSVTPAQMCTLLGCVLNDGQWRPLRVVDAWTDESGYPVETVPPAPARQPVSRAASQQVCRMLEQVVETGTAKLARSAAFIIGGKTGTANKINPVTKRYDRHRQVVSFLGYIASGGGPRLAGIVIVDEPRLDETLNYGGRLAAPLFRRIAEKAMAYYNVPALVAASGPADSSATVKK